MLSELGKQLGPVPDGPIGKALQVDERSGPCNEDLLERPILGALNTHVFELSPSACVATMRMSALLS